MAKAATLSHGGRSAFQGRPQRRDCIRSLAAFGPSGLGKIGAAAAALPAKCRRCNPYQIDRRPRGLQIIGDPDRHRGAPVVDNNQHHNTRNHRLLGIIDQPAQAFGIKPVENLPDEADTANRFGTGRTRSLRPVSTATTATPATRFAAG